MTSEMIGDSKPAAAYQFGDSDVAADRLRRLAEVFEPSTREFLASLAVRRPRRIADLGCGPGYVTRLLGEVFPEATIHGLDSSEHFIQLARRATAERMSFDVADVTHSLAGGPYDLIYSRYLLTHVPDWRAAVQVWSQRLSPGGAIAIEENEWIHPDQPAFARYLEIVGHMLSARGQKLYVGAEMDRTGAGPDLQTAVSELVPIPVTARATAGMFLPNLRTWRSNPFIQQNHSVAEIDALEKQLEKLVEDDAQQPAIEFGRRRLVFERR